MGLFGKKKSFDDLMNDYSEDKDPKILEGSPYSLKGPVAERPHEHRAKKLSASETRINSMVS